ncbi:MAG: hypothetical protein ACXU9U_05200 [Parachlamydiaceae bacterium]
MNPLICPIRKAAVSTLPEERVGVQLLYDLIKKLGFPQRHITVVNAEDICTGWIDKATGLYHFVPYLPTYEQLMLSFRQ